MLAAIILGLCGIGVYAIHNVEFDLWTLLWFGILGVLMRQFGFPLAPMILGVVLGNIAELNLARAMAITTDLTLFVTRPWALFFLIIAIFSSAFPIYQVYRGAKKWTMFYLPVACFAVSGPLFMMGGVPRTTLAAVVVLFGAYTLWRRQQAGWVFERDEEEIDEPQISEGK
jgi:putative tricarboxylic transport membrane protein